MSEIGKIAKRLGGRLEKIQLNDIGVADRYRKDYGDLNELALSLETKGQLQNIVVCDCDCESNGFPLKLLAGGRRYKTMTEVLKWTEANALIFDRELNELEMLEIEWEENSMRKELGWREDIAIKARILELRLGDNGQKLGGGAKSGVSLRDISAELGINPATLSIDRKLNAAVMALPEVFSDVKNKNQAIKLLNKATEQSVRQELARRTQERAAVNENGYLRSIIDRFIVGDFFDGIKNIPAKSINFIEIDPPYAINLKSVKQNPNQLQIDKYNEITPDKYPLFMANVMKEAMRVMAAHSYGILWHAADWKCQLFELIKAVGFESTMLTGKWIKSQGQTNMPQKYLANSCEEFFYFWKGNPSIVKEGRLNTFLYNGVPHQKKYHPAERPLELITDILSTFCFEGAQICVPFLGSGKTILAAEQLKMKAFGWELSPEYKDGFITSAERMFLNADEKFASILEGI